MPDEPVFRQLLPEPCDRVEPAAAYARPADREDGRPTVRVNMIASVDGATTVDGLSGGLGGPGDRAVFATLRSLADVVLVGTGTVRSEHYGPVRFDDAAQQRRAALGLAPVPPIAVVTASAALDWDSRFFTEAVGAPIVVTTERGAETVQGRAEVVVAGADRVEPVRILDALGALGFRHVLCEGGPSLNGQLAAAGLLDELCLTLAPFLVGGPSSRILTGAGLTPPTGLALHHALEADGSLFLRYARRPTPPGP